MQFLLGTSGYSYPGWKGRFYPPKLSPKEMLSFYSQRFATVELNNTFYRMPDQKVVQSWVGQVPDTFQFAIKAPQTITHRKRLKDVGPDIDQLLDTLSALKGLLGPLLIQLPPNLKKDVPRLESFLELLKDRALAAFEFRHESWFDDEVTDCLRTHGCPLCTADVEDGPDARIVGTATWGYVRLRRDSYTDSQLKQWIKQLRSQAWTRTYVFFKHDDVGMGPTLAAHFLELAGA
jgi:uncharacterized protein YecE (DUF72 family)